VRHTRIDRWSRMDSPLHRRHAAGKAIAGLGMLICIASLGRPAWRAAGAYLLLLAAGTAAAKLPVPRILLGGAVVLPFAAGIAVIAAVSGDSERAAMVLVRAYLSSLTTLLLVASTPLPELLAGLEKLGAPEFLLQVMQFVYRYLMVLREEAGAMRDAAASRAGTVRVLEFRKAAGAAGVLFARAHNRAQAIHRAMVARGFEGRMPALRQLPFRMPDAVFAAGTLAVAVAVRAVLA